MSTPTPATHYAVRRPAFSRFLPDAVAHVERHGCIHPSGFCHVRYPLASPLCWTAEDTHELAKLVAKEMRRRAQA